MSLKTRFQSLMGEDIVPVLSREEAIERAAQYAEANGHRFSRACNVHMAWHVAKPLVSADRKRLVWSMALGTSRPIAFVDVDATDGTIVAWRQGPR